MEWPSFLKSHPKNRRLNALTIFYVLIFLTITVAVLVKKQEPLFPEALKIMRAYVACLAAYAFIVIWHKVREVLWKLPSENLPENLRNRRRDNTSFFLSLACACWAIASLTSYCWPKVGISVERELFFTLSSLVNSLFFLCAMLDFYYGEGTEPSWKKHFAFSLFSSINLIMITGVVVAILTFWSSLGAVKIPIKIGYYDFEFSQFALLELLLSVYTILYLTISLYTLFLSREIGRLFPIVAFGLFLTLAAQFLGFFSVKESRQDKISTILLNKKIEPRERLSEIDTILKGNCEGCAITNRLEKEKVDQKKIEILEKWASYPKRYLGTSSLISSGYQLSLIMIFLLLAFSYIEQIRKEQSIVTQGQLEKANHQMEKQYKQMEEQYTVLDKMRQHMSHRVKNSFENIRYLIDNNLSQSKNEGFLKGISAKIGAYKALHEELVNVVSEEHKGMAYREIKINLETYLNRIAEAYEKIFEKQDLFHHYILLSGRIEVKLAFAQVIGEWISELVINAYKYKMPGADRWVKLEVNDFHNILIIRVSDRGMGSSNDESLEGNVDNNSTTGNIGVSRKSFGLSAIENEVAEYQGKYNRRSNGGQGTVIEIMLPLQKQTDLGKNEIVIL